jgi:hypothetical protein
MSNDIIYLNKNVDDNIINTIKLLKIDNNRINIENNLVIKCISVIEVMHQIQYKDNTELFLIKKYLMNEFTHLNFLNYYAIIKFNNINLNIDNDQIKKLTIYKNSISPVLNKIVNNTTHKYENHGIIMPQYEKLSSYLNNNELDTEIILLNIIGILDLSILVRDKYNFIHPDVKLCNIVVNNNIFYLIDWEDAFHKDEMYYNYQRPPDGNTEMYPHYNATAEQFLIHSIGVLIIRIVGFHSEISYKDFMDNIRIEYILSKIPNDVVKPFESLIMDIFTRKFNKIEELIISINKILDIDNKNE